MVLTKDFIELFKLTFVWLTRDVSDIFIENCWCNFLLRGGKCRGGIEIPSLTNIRTLLDSYILFLGGVCVLKNVWNARNVQISNMFRGGV